MTCCQNNCSYAALILGILAGVAVGVLYALGFVTVGVLLWVYLTLGVAALLLSPVYAALSPCFCIYRTAFLIGAFGAIVAAAVAFFTVGIAPLTLFAVILVVFQNQREEQCTTAFHGATFSGASKIVSRRKSRSSPNRAPSSAATPKRSTVLPSRSF